MTEKEELYEKRVEQIKKIVPSTSVARRVALQTMAMPDEMVEAIIEKRKKREDHQG